VIRRQFVAWLSLLVALPATLRAAVRRRTTAQSRVPSQAAVRALGGAVLPAEMGRGRIEVASDAFWRWMDGYREGAELLHPYGSPRISYTPASPVPLWSRQLAALERSAQERFQTSFTAASMAQRQTLIREELASHSGERLPSVAAAPHVALGLLAHFYASSAATDLCYQAQIGRNQCRPLVHNGRRPLPTVRR
jgi:hypothetical protein